MQGQLADLSNTTGPELQTVDLFLNILLEIRVNQAILALSVCWALIPKSWRTECSVSAGERVYIAAIKALKVICSTKFGMVDYISIITLQVWCQCILN